MGGIKVVGEERDKEKRKTEMFIQTLQELSHMEAIKEQKVQEDQSETSMVTEKESMCHMIILQIPVLYKVPVSHTWV